MRRPIWEITGIKRTVIGNKEVAKGVASRGRAAVAWSIEATPVVRRIGLITPNSPRSRLIFKTPSHQPLLLRDCWGRKADNSRRKPWHWRDRTRQDCVGNST